VTKTRQGATTIGDKGCNLWLIEPVTNAKKAGPYITCALVKAHAHAHRMSKPVKGASTVSICDRAVAPCTYPMHPTIAPRYWVRLGGTTRPLARRGAQWSSNPSPNPNPSPGPNPSPSPSPSPNPEPDQARSGARAQLPLALPAGRDAAHRQTLRRGAAAAAHHPCGRGRGGAPAERLTSTLALTLTLGLT
jgi:hypothetical protein